MKSLNSQKRQMIATEIIDADEFYLQDPKSKQLDEITKLLSAFNPTE